MVTREELLREKVGRLPSSWMSRVCDMALALLDVADLVPGANDPEAIVKRLRGMDECFSTCQMALHDIQDLVPGEGDVVERVRELKEELDSHSADERVHMLQAERISGLQEQLRRAEAERDEALKAASHLERGITALRSERDEAREALAAIKAGVR